MQAVVKTPHIEINIRGINIPSKVISFLKKEYGHKLKLIKNEEDEFVDIFETDWYMKTKKTITPGFNLKLYRKMKNLTQEDLGRLIGNTPKQHISNMEKELRPISLTNAKKFSKIFGVSIEKFV